MTVTKRVNVHVLDHEINVELTIHDCANCGVVFGMPSGLEQSRRGDGGDFYCPNGHNLTFGQGEADKLREQLKRSRSDSKWYSDALIRESEERRHAEGSLRATKGHLTRVKRRIEAGVCIHCNRTFQNVARHMEAKHGPETSDG